MRKGLTPDVDLKDFLDEPQPAVLATNFADGTTLLSPVWHEWRDGGFTIMIFTDDIKGRHIRRDPRVSVVVAEALPPLRGIEVRGIAQLSPAEDLDTLRRIARRYLGQQRGDAYSDTFDVATQSTLRLVPGVLRAWDFADELPVQV
jgi:PPOX class probable F420-dependent enzyme